MFAVMICTKNLMREEWQLDFREIGKIFTISVVERVIVTRITTTFIILICMVTWILMAGLLTTTILKVMRQHQDRMVWLGEIPLMNFDFMYVGKYKYYSPSVCVPKEYAAWLMPGCSPIPSFQRACTR